MYNAIVIDDEKRIREGLCKFFETKNIGFKCSKTFADGTEAYDYIKNNPDQIDVILTDIRMKNMSGIELTQKLRDDGIDLQIIFLSGYAEFEYAQEAIKHKVFSYILKPIRFNKLCDVLNELKTELDKKKIADLNTDNLPANIIILICELEAGMSDNSDRLLQRINMLNLPTGLVDLPCCYISIKKNWDNMNKKYFWDQYDNIILNILLLENDVAFYKIHTQKTYLTLYAVPKSPINIADFEAKMKNIFSSLATKICGDLKLDFNVTVENVKYFENLFGFAKYFSRFHSDDLEEKLKNVFVTNLINGDTSEAQCALNSLIEKTSMLGEVHKHNILNDFFRLITNLSAEQDTDSINTDLNNVNADDCRDNLFHKAIEFINDNFQKDITLTDVANYVYLNPIYFGRIFKQKTGKTFIDYITGLRMDLACDLLSNTNLKVKEICEKVGYYNEVYFITVFKRKLGTTPGNWRKEQRLK